MSARPGARTIRTRTVALACAGVAGLVGASGCSGVHLSHPGRTAACAQALPAAFLTVHSRGRLVGFRVVRRRSDLRTLYLALGARADSGARTAPGAVTRPRRRLHQPRPQVIPLAAAPGTPPPRGPLAQPARAVCLAVFQGRYDARDAAGAPPGDRGRYAVLIIFIRHAAVIRTRLIDVLPVPVRRLL